MSRGKQAKEHWPLWLRLLLWLGIPLAILVIVLWVFSATGRARLDRALEEARASGLPLTFEEIEAARRTWADEDNGALIIVNLGPQLDQIRKENSESPVPCVGDREWPKLGRRWTDEMDKLAAAELERRAGVLAELDRLADFKGGRFPVTIAPNPVETLRPHLAQLRSAAELERLQIIQRAMRGEAASLGRGFDVMFTMGRLVDDEPTLISALVGTAVERLTLDTAQRVCGLTELEPALLEHLDAQLRAADRSERMYWAMLGERAMFVGIHEWMETAGPGGTDSLEIPKYKSMPGASGMFYHDEARGLRLYNRLVKASQDPQQGRQAAREVESELEHLPFYCVTTRILMPSLERALVLHLRTKGQLRSARAALAAERYRIDHGHWPAALGELVPAYLDAVPLDPFDNQPLRYRVDADGIVVYSIGEDLTDDGGQLSRPPDKEEAPDWGFRLLDPSLRGLPPEPPSTSSAPSP